MFKYQVRIDTGTDVANFVRIAESLSYEITIENGDGTKRGNAKTLLNVIDAMTYDKIYVISDNDMYTPFRDFILS
jgi:hypothetical protein